MSTAPHPLDLASSPDHQTLPASSVVHEVLGATRFDDEPLPATLGRLVVVAQHALPGRPEVSITLVQAGQPRTLASSGELAWRLDQYQYRHGAGPCLSAASTGHQVCLLTGSPPEEDRAFAEAALGAGVVQVLSLSLAAGSGAAALNFYTTSDQPIDQHRHATARTIAGYLSAFMLKLAAHQHADQLARAPESRRALG